MSTELSSASSSTASTPHETARITQIDALRGLAAMWVLLFHFSSRYEELFGHTPPLAFYLPDGRLGVHLFFMISGFVILMSIDRVTRVRDFIFFRFARLYPTFWICALITFVVMSFAPLPGRTVPPLHALMNVSMVPITTGFKPIDPVYWSLEIELFFYGLIAALVTLKLRSRIVAVLTLLVGINLLFLALPGPVTELPKIIKLIRLCLSMRYLHFFLFGILCYELFRSRAHTKSESPPSHRFIYVLALALCMVTTFAEAPTDEFVITVGLGILFYAATALRIRLLDNSVLLTLGACSYPLYTIHQNIGYVVIHALEGFSIHPFVSIAAATILVIGTSIGISRLVELPSNRWLRSKYRSMGKDTITTAKVGGLT